MGKQGLKPVLFEGGHVLFITSAFPPSPGGSCVLNQNLLINFDENSFTVISNKSTIKRIEVLPSIKVKRVLRSNPKIGSYNQVYIDCQRWLAIRRIKRIAQNTNTKLIIGTYPNFGFLSIAYKVAQDLGLPFVAYLHDTIFEANIGKKLEGRAKHLNEKILHNSELIFVISDGIKKLYLKKYNTKTIPLRHTYSEPIVEMDDELIKSKSFFWGGAIYDINARSLARLSRKLNGHNCKLELATNTSIKSLDYHGFDTSVCELTFYESRTEYLEALIKSDVLILALDDSAKTRVHYDELSTIFPTKTPEYLASGKPIIVICPRDYFLSNFFLEHNCGFVFEVDELENFEKILGDLKNRVDVNLRVSNARKVLNKYFRNTEVVKVLRRELQKLAK